MYLSKIQNSIPSLTIHDYPNSYIPLSPGLFSWRWMVVGGGSRPAPQGRTPLSAKREWGEWSGDAGLPVGLLHISCPQSFSWLFLIETLFLLDFSLIPDDFLRSRWIKDEPRKDIIPHAIWTDRRKFPLLERAAKRHQPCHLPGSARWD